MYNIDRNMLYGKKSCEKQPLLIYVTCILLMSCMDLIVQFFIFDQPQNAKLNSSNYVLHTCTCICHRDN